MRLKFPSPLAQYIYNTTHDENGKKQVTRDAWDGFLEDVNVMLLKIMVDHLPIDRKKLAEPLDNENVIDHLTDCLDDRASEKMIQARLEESGLMISDYAVYENITRLIGMLQSLERAKTYDDINTPCENIEKFMRNYFGVPETELIEQLRKAKESESVPPEHESKRNL